MIDQSWYSITREVLFFYSTHLKLSACITNNATPSTFCQCKFEVGFMLEQHQTLYLFKYIPSVFGGFSECLKLTNRVMRIHVNCFGLGSFHWGSSCRKGSLMFAALLCAPQASTLKATLLTLWRQSRLFCMREQRLHLYKWVWELWRAVKGWNVRILHMDSRNNSNMFSLPTDTRVHAFLLESETQPQIQAQTYHQQNHQPCKSIFAV